MIVQGGLSLSGPLNPVLEMSLFMPVAVNKMALAIGFIVIGFDEKALVRLGLRGRESSWQIGTPRRDVVGVFYHAIA